MSKKRKCPRMPRRIELKINNVTLIIKHPVKWTINNNNYPHFNYTPFTPTIEFDPFDIRNNKGLVQAATGKSLEEIIEEQERIESKANALQRLCDFWIKQHNESE